MSPLVQSVASHVRGLYQTHMGPLFSGDGASENNEADNSMQAYQQF